MKDTKPKPETPPLSRSGRKIADAALTAAIFTPTTDGKAAIRTFEVHGMEVTEQISSTYAIPNCSVSANSKGPVLTDRKNEATGLTPATPSLTRAGRREAEATLAAAKFVPSSDGKKAMRQFKVHGIEVTEFVSTEVATDSRRVRK